MRFRIQGTHMSSFIYYVPKKVGIKLNKTEVENQQKIRLWGKKVPENKKSLTRKKYFCKKKT